MDDNLRDFIKAELNLMEMEWNRAVDEVMREYGISCPDELLSPDTTTLHTRISVWKEAP